MLLRNRSNYELHYHFVQRFAKNTKCDALQHNRKQVAQTYFEIIVTITRHIFIYIFKTEHFLAVKFDIGSEKNMSFLVMPKAPKVEKKLKKSEWTPSTLIYPPHFEDFQCCVI